MGPSLDIEAGIPVAKAAQSKGEIFAALGGVVASDEDQVHNVSIR